MLAVYYGVRRSEALGLSWGNVDFEHKEIRICQKAMEISRNGKKTVVINDTMKTESSRRTLPLIPDVEDILLKHKAKQEAYQKQFRKGYSQEHLGMVFVDQVGNLLKPNYVTTRFPKMLKKYGLRPIRYHDPRHTCASLLLGKNINMKLIQMWLGHSNMSTTVNIKNPHKIKQKSKQSEMYDKSLPTITILSVGFVCLIIHEFFILLFVIYIKNCYIL